MGKKNGLEEDEGDALRKHSGGDKHRAPAEALDPLQIASQGGGVGG